MPVFVIFNVTYWQKSLASRMWFVNRVIQVMILIYEEKHIVMKENICKTQP